MVPSDFQNEFKFQTFRILRTILRSFSVFLGFLLGVHTVTGHCKSECFLVSVEPRL